MADPRTNREGRLYPAIASHIAKIRGATHPSMPPYVGFMKHRSHVAEGGWLGKAYDPFNANQAVSLPVYDLLGKDTGTMSNASLFKLPAGLSHDRLFERRQLLKDFDSLRNDVDASGVMESMDHYGQQAVEMLLGQRAQEAFNLSNEPARVRDRYGKHLWCQQALLARRLVEAGVAFVTIDLSYHTASGTWDNHGDAVYLGITRGLKPLLPLFDHLFTTLVRDLEERGLLDEVLVVAMGEFGRTPVSSGRDKDGRDHWPVVMSMALAGGGFRHGQVIGATEKDGGKIKVRRVTPGDLAATIYHHMGVPLDGTYLDTTGRPRLIVENGAPIRELL